MDMDLVMVLFGGCFPFVSTQGQNDRKKGDAARAGRQPGVTINEDVILPTINRTDMKTRSHF